MSEEAKELRDSKEQEELAAAELVLGTLSPEAALLARALQRRDADFAALVAAWERRLAPLDEATAPMAPPAGLWQRIEQVLAERAERKPAQQRLGPERAHPRGLAQEGERIIAGLRRRLWRWRLASFASAAAALALFALVLLEPLVPRESPGKGATYVAVLEGQEGKPGFLVTVKTSPPRLLVRSLGMSAPPAKNYELWLIPPDKAPATLGLVARNEVDKLEMPEKLAPGMLKEGVKLAVSLEPKGGAPAGQPMGPVVFAGELLRVVN